MRKEGEVWTERGKTWTIKNGVKRTLSKFSEIRKNLQTPLCCPKCSRVMKQIDQHMYSYNKVCLNCTVEYEHELKKAGLYEEYEKRRMEANIKDFVLDMDSFFKDYLADESNKSFVTEEGSVETWIGNTNKVVEDIVKPNIEELKQKYVK